MTKPFILENPLLVAFEQNGKLTVHLYPDKSKHTHAHYGLLVADLVKHVAKCFGVSDEDVWEWVDKERENPTTDFKVAS